MVKYIDEALAEDVVDINGRFPSGDHSSLACIPVAVAGRARLLCKAGGILAGVAVAEEVCRRVDESLVLKKMMEDGSPFRMGDVAFEISGEVKSILRAERVLLNFMQRMSGIATHTAQYVERVKGTGAVILDTRKTTPNFRFFEKWAVRIGGGQNHRYGLYDMVMLKDNHIDYCGGIAKAIHAVKNYLEQHQLNLRVEVEARTLRDVEEILTTGHVHRIMFDNFSPELMTQAVKLVNRACETEASGGINLETVRAAAETGVDFISVGALTHSSRSLDLSLKAF